MFLIHSSSLHLVLKASMVSQAFTTCWGSHLQITMSWLKASKTTRS